MREKMLRTTQIYSLLGCFLLLMVVGSAQAFLIDSFNDTFQIVLKAAPGPVTSATAAGEAVGDFRTMEMLSVAGPLGATLAAHIGDALSLSNDALTSSMSIVIWDASGAGLGGVDLTDVGTSSFVILDILSIDIGGVDIEMTITDTGGDVATKLISGAGAGVFEVLFADFVNFTATDFTSVDAITMKLTADEASDLVLDFVATSGAIPEPSSLVLLGMGILGVVGYGWRRRKKVLPNNSL